MSHPLTDESPSLLPLPEAFSLHTGLLNFLFMFFCRSLTLSFDQEVYTRIDPLLARMVGQDFLSCFRSIAFLLNAVLSPFRDLPMCQYASTPPSLLAFLLTMTLLLHLAMQVDK